MRHTSSTANRGASYAGSDAQNPDGDRPFPWALVVLSPLPFFCTTRVSQLIMLALVFPIPVLIMEPVFHFK